MGTLPTLFLFVAAAVLLVGAGLVAVGWRGRRVDDDPHCRACGFNLRGRDLNSTRCAECGADLHRARAVRTGMRERRPAALGSGALLLLLALGAFGLDGWQRAKGYNWAPWKPTAWLLHDVDNLTGPDRVAAVDELRKRLADPATPAEKAMPIIDRALDRQGDHAVPWNSAWQDLFEAAHKAKRLDGPRLERYLKQGVTAKLKVKPRLRRGQYVIVDLDVKQDRYLSGTRLFGQYPATPLTLGPAVLSERFFGEREPREQELGSGHGMHSQQSLGEKQVAALPDGPHEMKTVVRATLRSSEPIVAGPVTVELPTTAPVELLPADATVDEFKVDEAQRDAMRRAVEAARVFYHPDGVIDVRVKARELPVPLAADVVLVQGSREEPIGTIRFEPGKPAQWIRSHPDYRRRKLKIEGTVDVHLRPSQKAADSTLALATYWGEPIVVPGVVVNAPYVPPFNTDESHRAAMEKAIEIPELRRRPPGAAPRRRGSGSTTAASGPATAPSSGIDVSLQARNPPLKVAFIVLVSVEGRETRITEWNGPAGGNFGYHLGAPNVAVPETVTHVDVIFRPDPDWEINASDPAPPWGGEIIKRRVPILPPVK